MSKSKIVIGIFFAVLFSLIVTGISNADLQGSWNYHGLISGDAPDQLLGWYHGKMSVAGNGTVTFNGPIIDSVGHNDYTPSGGTVNLSPDGVLTIPGIPSYHGIIAQSKDMIIATATMAPGRVNS
jgi:hypothetical protein